MVGLPPLCAGADCNVKASPAMSEIADSVNVIGIVTNAFSRNSVCVYPSVAIAAVLLELHSQPFTGRVLSFFSH